jgi:prepilin-type N-terminal cleavage/methylation domain-containing protein
MTQSRSHSRQAGFTLVELLVAIAVLAIILVAAATILSTTAALTTVTNKHMDANDQARMVFDRLGNDFARMVKRKDVDYIFWKNTGNDVMYFYTEGASYFDSTTFSLASGYTAATGGYMAEKNSVSLVGYRVNNTATVGVAPYYQLERLGKALSWDGGAYNSAPSSNNSKQPNFVAFLTYPPAGNDVVNGPSFTDPTSISYSAAYFNSTLAGAYSNNNGETGSNGVTLSSVGTYPGATAATTTFNDSTDTSYRTVGTQVFRFEYCFQLKDGTFTDKPMMVYTGSGGLPGTNGVPSSNIVGGNNSERPLPTDDSANTAGDGTTNVGPNTYSIGSRWWDSTNHIGYICLDATPSYAVWHEIGVQDVAAIIVTIAVIDKQGLAFVNANNGNLGNIAALLPDYTAGSNPAYLLDPTQTTGWAYALLPSDTTGVSTILPQSMTSQIRIYQRHFYLNNF